MRLIELRAWWRTCKRAAGGIRRALQSYGYYDTQVYGGIDVSRSQVQTAGGGYASSTFIGKQVGERL